MKQHEGLNMTGRPKWIPDNSVCEQAREMASRGLTVSQISDCLGISESTLYGKQNEFKEFMGAIKKKNPLNNRWLSFFWWGGGIWINAITICFV